MRHIIESEKNLERKLNKAIKQNDGICVKLLTTFSNIGLPDRMCILKNKIFFVELKSTGKKPRPIQIFMINKLRNLGFNVYVVDSTETMEKMFSDEDIIFLKNITGHTQDSPE